jgi:hypothetical protein
MQHVAQLEQLLYQPPQQLEQQWIGMMHQQRVHAFKQER